MKRFISTFIMTSLLALVPLVGTSTASAATAASSAASSPTYCYNSRTGRYYRCKKPNFYRRHRKAINIGAGAVAGMVLGGLLGGRKGVAIGALAGAGGGYLVTKKQRPKNYIRYYRQ